MLSTAKLMKSIVALLREEGVKVWSSKSLRARDRIVFDGMQRIISLKGVPEHGLVLHLATERDKLAVYNDPCDIEFFELADPDCFKKIVNYLRVHQK